MPDDALETEVAAGNMLSDAGMHEQAIEHFRALCARLPREPRVQFALAGALAAADREADAVPVYAAAIKLRPTGELLARAYLGLGSSLSNLERHQEALEVLSAGSRRFPEHAPLRAYLALATADTGKPRDAVIALVEDLLEHHDMGSYKEPLRLALKKLQRTPRR